MQYYTFVLDDKSKDLCTITTPFGLYKYNCLPMGICQSPSIAQEIMELVLRDIIDIKVYPQPSQMQMGHTRNRLP